MPKVKKSRTINLYREPDETKLLKEVAPMYMRASKDSLIDDFFKALREIWEDRFPGSITPVHGAEAEWRRSIREQMIWIGPIHGKDYGAQDFDDWQYRMTIDFDRHRRRTDYFAYARLGRLLQGHQYNVVVSDEMRARLEKSPEERLQEVIQQLEEDLEAGIYFA
ncbi:hypothetical protein DXG01_012706 [Tephrocybe rancida]|nr:hypothetical protein DXG01_012706 [Tephrocybe rancida]